MFDQAAYICQCANSSALPAQHIRAVCADGRGTDTPTRLRFIISGGSGSGRREHSTVEAVQLRREARELYRLVALALAVQPLAYFASEVVYKF